MKRPERIKIVGKRFRVQYLPEVTNDAGEPCYGTSDVTKQLILIEDGMPHERERDTLLHECIHAIDDQLNMGLDEDQVARLATTILALLLDNPAFARYLLEREKGAPLATEAK